MKKQKGQSLGEWTVAVIAISIAIMGTLFAFAPSMNGVLNSINNAIDSGSNVSINEIGVETTGSGATEGVTINETSGSSASQKLFLTETSGTSTLEEVSGKSARPGK